jgi:hypothetical protein
MNFFKNFEIFSPNKLFPKIYSKWPNTGNPVSRQPTKLIDFGSGKRVYEIITPDPNQDPDPN